MTRSKIFWFGLGIKVTFLFFFGSHYIRELFIPFLDSSITHLGQNPWALNPPHFFPYGSVLFLSLFVFKLVGFFVAGQAALGDGPLGLALVKLPLLAFDLLLCWTLIQFAKQRCDKILVYYWLNPILFFITYIHGQLDVAAISLSILSVYFLIKDRFSASSIAMACAVLCKFQVIVSIPLILVFIWNRDFARPSLQKILAWSSLFLVLVVIGLSPHFLAKQVFYISTASPEAQRIFSAQLPYGGGLSLMLGVLAMILLTGRLCLSTSISEKGLLFGSGALLGALVFVTDPGPGWYYWIVPYLALLFGTHVNIPRLLFWALEFCYFMYFCLQPNLPGLSQSLAPSLSFTLLQAALLANLVALWFVALRREIPLINRARPTTIGIAGDSGAGKSRLSETLEDLFTPTNSLILAGDDYHKWERGHDRWETYTHLNPKANHLLDLSKHIELLAQGIPIQKSHYDHGTGRFSEPSELKPGRTLIVQGLHSFYLRGMRENYDLKIFISPAEQVRLAWKVKRDFIERGHSPEKVRKNIEARSQDSEWHILPQIVYADWIIGYEPITKDVTSSADEVRIRARHVVWNDVPVVPLIESLQRVKGLKADVELVPDDINRLAIVVEGNLDKENVKRIAEEIFSNLRQITRARRAPEWRGGFDGLAQLLTLTMLSRARAEEPFF